MSTAVNLNPAAVRFEKYLFPRTFEECVKILSENRGNARVVAGGTDLLLWARAGKISQSVVVDITRIEGIDAFEAGRDELILGAGMTHAEVASNRDVKDRFKSLSDGCRSVGSPQIRHIATLGGNIVSAQPAADSVIPMVAIGARCEVISPEGVRIESVGDLHKGVGISKIDPTREVIGRIFLPIPKGRYATAFARTASREAMALPTVNAAVRIVLEGDIVTSAWIAIAPVAVTPFRAREAEGFLEGKSIRNPDVLAEAAKIASREAKPRDSLVRGSGEYRKVLVGDLVESALREAAGNVREGV